MSGRSRTAWGLWVDPVALPPLFPSQESSKRMMSVSLPDVPWWFFSSVA